MKITLAMVMSVDGKTTRGSEQNIYAWTSREDQIYFRNLIDHNMVIIMGRGTFNASKDMIAERLTPKTLRLVVTDYPEQYRDLVVPGQLEFTSDSPVDIIDNLALRGYTKALLIGGHELCESFLSKGLVDDFFLTIEPKLFGLGKPLLLEKSLHNINLRLLSHEVLNSRGTVVLHYQIVKGEL